VPASTISVDAKLILVLSGVPYNQILLFVWTALFRYPRSGITYGLIIVAFGREEQHPELSI
jgi:hypothetical protein